jgi:hypothetical protein
MSALRPLLADSVHPDIHRWVTLDIDDGEKITADGTVLADYSPERPLSVCAFVEVKNEVGTGACDPALQCQSDFVKLCSATTVGVPPTHDRKLAECHSIGRLLMPRAAPCSCWR